MNKKMILSLLGKIVLLEAGLMLLPLIVSVIYQEKNACYYNYCLKYNDSMVYHPFSPL